MRKIKAVIGLGFGDEGKGMVTAALARESNNPMIVRFNGGQQAGHTVVHKGHRHVFSSFGSGTLDGYPTHFGKYCTVYPTGMLNESELLAHFLPKLEVDPMCAVTTPYDVYADSRNLVGDTVGTGHGTTLARQEANYTLYAKDLRYPLITELKLNAIKAYYGHPFSVTLDAHQQFLADCVAWEYQVRVMELQHAGDLILEGAQGVLLDQRYGFFPHVTRSNTTSINALRMGFIPTEIWMVTRAYHTRHGRGPLPGETRENLVLKNNEKETNVRNATQGEFRIAPLNLDLLNYAIKCETQDSRSIPKNLVMTCCDQVEAIPYIYEYTPGHLYHNFTPEGDFLMK